MGVGLAFSPGSSGTACLPVPVLQKEVTNRSQAVEVLRISPDTKQNKNRRVCLVCKASMYPVWPLEPYLPFTGVGLGGTKYERTRHLQEFLQGCWASGLVISRRTNFHRAVMK